MKNLSKPIVVLTCLLFGNALYAQTNTAEMVFSNSENSITHKSMSQNTSMEVYVSGLMIKVKVRQQFRNNSNEWMNGRYLFPLPETAAVNEYRLRVDEKLIESEVHEKSEARKIYQTAKANGQQAALIDSQRANLFSTEIANVAAGSVVETELVYYDQVHYENGIFSLRLLTTLTPRFNGKQAETIVTGIADADLINPPMTHLKREDRDNLTLQMNINAGLPIATIQSTTHDIEWLKHDSGYDVSLRQGTAHMDRDAVISWQLEPSSTPHIATFSESYADKQYVNLLVVPPESISHKPIPRTIIFVVDTSGSMSGISILQARQSLQNAMKRLDTNQYFNVIEFNDRARVFYPEPLLATSQNLTRAIQAVDSLNADGGTNMYTALTQAFEQPTVHDTIKQIIFITDGSVGDEQGLFSLIKQRINNDRLFTVGIGSAPNSHFMRKAAKYGRGTFTYVDNLNQVKNTMDKLFEKLERPVLQDIAISWPASSAAIAYPEPIPDLYHGQPLQITAELEQAGGEVNITGRLGKELWQKNVKLPTKDNSQGTHIIWAKASVDNYLEARIDGISDELIKPKVVAVGLLHQLVTPFTSMVAVDKTPVNSNPENNLDTEVENLMPSGNTMRINYPQTATNADQHILVALGLMLMLFLRSLLRPVERRS